MDVIAAIKNRRSVRRYKPEPVAPELVKQVLEAGNWAPSGMNRQQWEFLVVGGEAKKQMGLSYGQIGESYAEGWESAARDAFLEYTRTYGGAPLVLVVLTDASDQDNIRKMNIESASAALQNIMLAAWAAGLGTCWMTGPLLDQANLHRILAIGPDKEILAVTPLGYPAEIPPAPPRIDPELKHKVRWLE